MENGIYHYDLEMHTPLGIRRGNLELEVKWQLLTGSLTMFTRTIPIRGGTCSGSSVSFTGDMKTMMKLLPYQASGTISPGGIALTIETQQGTYTAAGTLTDARREQHV